MLLRSLELNSTVFVIESLEFRRLLSATLISGSADENSGTYTLAFNAPSQGAGSSWNINWGDGSSVQTASTALPSVVHSFTPGGNVVHHITASIGTLANPIDNSFGGPTASGTIITAMDSPTGYGYRVRQVPANDPSGNGGKMIVASGPGLSLVRYNTNGTLDTTFNGTGKTSVTSNGQAYGMVIQSDGKYIVGGGANFSLARFNPDGTLDSTFGTNGTVSSGFGTTYEGYDLTLAADGKIIEVGKNANDFVVARFNTDGSVDSTFGHLGKTTTDFSASYDKGYAVTLDATGRILVVGQARFAGPNYNWAIARYTVNGVLDTTFGTQGKQTIEFGSTDDAAWAVDIQNDGKIIVAGRGQIGSNFDFALARLTVDGQLDASFGSGGKILTDFYGGSDQAYAVSLLPDGRIAAAGRTDTSGGSTDFGLAMYNSDGSLVTTFGTGGLVHTDFRGTSDYGESLLAQDDGDLVIAGASSNSSGTDVAIARYHVLASDAIDSISSLSPALSGTIGTNNLPSLSWSDLSGVGAGFYTLYRSDDGVNYQIVDGGDWIDGTSLYDADAPTNTPVWYKLTATQHDGTSSLPSNVVQLSRPVDITAPTAPSSLTGVANSYGVNLDWVASTSADATKYNVYRSESADGIGVFLGSTESTAFTDGGTIGDGSETYYVTAVDQAQNESSRINTSVDTGLPDNQPPSPPADVAVARDANGVYTVTWTSNPEADLAGYRIYEAESLQGQYISVNDTPIQDNTYVEDSVPTNQQMFFKISAVDKTGNESLAVNSDTTPPASPGNPAASGDETGILLTWTAPSDADLSGYRIYRRLYGRTGDFVLLDDIDSSQVNYVDSLAPTATNSQYEIVAYDTSNNESAAVAADATRPLAAPTGVVADAISTTAQSRQVNVQWDDSNQDGSTWTVYRGTTSAFIADGSSQIAAGLSTLNFIDSAALPGINYYKVVQTTSTFISAPSDAMSADTDDVEPPDTPDWGQAQSEIGGVLLTWSVSSTRSQGYRVDSSDPNQPDGWASIGDVGPSTFSYQIPSANLSANGLYRVRAYNTAGEATGIEIQL